MWAGLQLQQDFVTIEPFDYIESHCSEINNCISLTRISIILGYYKEWIIIQQQQQQQEENKIDNNSMYDFINNIFNNHQYSNIELINDYHHLLNNHSNQFEDIHNKIIQQFNYDITNCLSSKRNYSLNNNNNNNKLYFVSSKKDGYMKEKCIQQILDIIYCYYVNSIEIGYFQSKKIKEMIQFSMEKDKIENNENKENKRKPSLIFKSFGRASFTKKPIYKKQKEVNEMINLMNYIKKERNKKKNKYCKELYDGIYRRENNRFSSMTRYIDDIFGYRYYYNSKWKTNINNDPYNYGYKYKEWWIKYKYDSLKNELLNNNNNNNIDIEEWNEISERAQNYLQTNICKKLKNDITINHIIAILLYTNYSEIEYKLNITYYKNPFNLESNQSLKDRHSSFAQLGRYLSECVQIYGIKSGFTKKIKYYHIINNKSINIPASINYNAPLSVTSSEIIAINALYSYESYNNNNNNNNNGLLLEIGARNTKHFDCKYWSNYPNENEIIFMYCKTPLIIQNIIDIDLGLNYHLYLYSYSVINLLLIGGDIDNQNGINFQIDLKIINPIYCYLYKKFYGKKNNLCCQSLPIYIEQLFKSYFDNNYNININWHQLNKIKQRVSGFGKMDTFNIKIISLILPFIMYYQIEWIKWHLLIKAFPKLKILTISGLKLTHSQFEDILFQIKNIYNINNYSIQKLILKDVRQHQLSFHCAYEKYNPRFNKLKWELANPRYQIFEIRRIQQVQN